MHKSHVTCQSGHQTIRLEDIAPGKSAAFSPNLYEFMKARAHFSPSGGVAESVFKVKDGSKAAAAYGAGALMIGFITNGLLIGANLNSALSNGAAARCEGLPVATSLEEVLGFWESYLELGRCAIDPKHQESFLSDRFHEQGNSRTCRWCGHHQTKVITTRSVNVEQWVAE